jgi:hypothetical protein
MIGQEAGHRLPRSYREGRLLRLLAGDLPGHWVEQASPGRARFVPVNGGPVFDVTERVDRRFLGHNEIAQFEVRLPSSATGAGRIQVRHTGRLKREGVRATIAEGDATVQTLATAIETDAPFVAAALPLDFTRFDIRRVGEEWVATVELMGASYVTVALPPMRSYVRLHSDQRDALVDSFSALSAVIRRAG